MLGAMLGVRVGPSEMFRMQWADVDFTQRLVRVQAAKKNIYEPWREIPIRAEILPLLTGLVQDRQGKRDTIHR